jgi:hypothetical protein
MTQKEITSTGRLIEVSLPRGSSNSTAALAKISLPIINDDDSPKGPYYIRRPFDREPGWGVSSINYNLSDLLQKAESP